MVGMFTEFKKGEVLDAPAPLDEITKLDFADNAKGIGVRGWTVPMTTGERFEFRTGMSDWAAMQLLHLLQQYAEARGLKPVSTGGSQPEGWNPYPADN